MKPAIHYSVKIKRLQYGSADDVKFIDQEEIFINKEPIKARIEAFNFYQSYVEVLLQSISKEYYSDLQARNDLSAYSTEVIEETVVHEFNFLGKGTSKISVEVKHGNSIGVYMIVDKPLESDNSKFNDHLIHEFGYDTYTESYWLSSLELEYDYYMLNKYITDNYESRITYCNPDEWLEGYREDEPSDYIILRTPFDWSNCEEPYWWEKADGESEESFQDKKMWLRILDGGEGTQIEFKSTLRYSLHKKVADKAIEHSIAKTIAAFLNTDGGILLVGVDDSAELLGLNADFGLYKQNAVDNFLKDFRNIVAKYLGLGVVSNLQYDFKRLNKKSFFYVEVSPSSFPIYLNNQGTKEFYCRIGTTSSKLDIEEAVNYVISKDWK